MIFPEDTLYGPVHSQMAIDIYKKAVDDAQKQVGYNGCLEATFHDIH